MQAKLGPRLRNDSEMLLRHATSPGWVVDGRPTSQLFALRPIDGGYLSVERSELAGGAAGALAHFNQVVRNSVSVWGVAVGEVHQEGLEAYEKPTRKLPAHALIDLSARSSDQQEISAVMLTRRAAERGKLA